MSFTSRGLVTILLVILVIVAGYFGILPRYSAYSTAKVQLQVQQQHQADLEKAQSQLQSFLDEYKKHATEASLINIALPLGKSEVYNILNSLDVITKQTGMTLAGLSITDTPETDQLGAQPHSIQSVTVQLTSSGSYESFKQFLSRLESNLRIIDITSAAMAAESKTSAAFSITFKTYYQK